MEVPPLRLCQVRESLENLLGGQLVFDSKDDSEIAEQLYAETCLFVVGRDCDSCIPRSERPVSASSVCDHYECLPHVRSAVFHRHVAGEVQSGVAHPAVETFSEILRLGAIYSLPPRLHTLSALALLHVDGYGPIRDSFREPAQSRERDRAVGLIVLPFQRAVVPRSATGSCATAVSRV